MGIFSGGRVDARIKVAFAWAWMAADSSIKGMEAVRLAEISIVIRAIQALASFSTFLLDDLNALIQGGSGNKALISETKYYARYLQYYRVEMRTLENTECLLYELYELANTLHICNRRYPNIHQKSQLAFASEVRLIHSFKIYKKIILMDMIILVRI